MRMLCAVLVLAATPATADPCDDLRELALATVAASEKALPALRSANLASMGDEDLRDIHEDTKAALLAVARLSDTMARIAEKSDCRR